MSILFHFIFLFTVLLMVIESFGYVWHKYEYLIDISIAVFIAVIGKEETR